MDNLDFSKVNIDPTSFYDESKGYSPNPDFDLEEVYPNYQELAPYLYRHLNLNEPIPQILLPIGISKGNYQNVKNLCLEFEIVSHLENICWFFSLCEKPYLFQYYKDYKIKNLIEQNEILKFRELLKKYQFPPTKTYALNPTQEEGTQASIQILYKNCKIEIKSNNNIWRLFNAIESIVSNYGQRENELDNLDQIIKKLDHQRSVPTIIRDRVSHSLNNYLEDNLVFTNNKGSQNKSKRFHFIGQFMMLAGHSYNLKPEDDPITAQKNLKDSVRRSIENEQKRMIRGEFD
jgi:hypothetical protein